MAVAIFGAADVSFAGHARLHVGLESSGSTRVLEELDIHGSGAVRRRGATTGSTEDALATTVGLVAYYFLAFGEGGEGGEGGKIAAKSKWSVFMFKDLWRLRRVVCVFCNVNQEDEVGFL